MTAVLTRGRRDAREAQKAEGQVRVKAGGGVGVMQLQAQGCQGRLLATRSWKREGKTLSGNFRGVMTLPTP